MAAISRSAIASLVAQNALAKILVEDATARAEVDVLIASLRAIFNRYEGVRFEQGFVVSIVTELPVSGVEKRANLAALIAVLDPAAGPHVIVTLKGDSALLRANDVTMNELSRYRYAGRNDETVSRKGVDYPLGRALNSYSNFAVDYYEDLEDALTMYEEIVLKRFDCDLLDSAWEDAKSRIFFAHRAEQHLRNSLERFLNTRLRGADRIQVFPEQNVDTEHPVDIRVDWAGHRLALVEIKWLGKSRSLKTGRFASEHDNGRAREGLQQLSDYIDAQQFRAVGTEVAGYLVVFDGRRGGMKPGMKRIHRDKAEVYRHRTLDLQEALLARPEMRDPRRWFVSVHPDVVDDAN